MGCLYKPMEDTRTLNFARDALAVGLSEHRSTQTVEK